MASSIEERSQLYQSEAKYGSWREGNQACEEKEKPALTYLHPVQNIYNEMKEERRKYQKI